MSTEYKRVHDFDVTSFTYSLEWIEKVVIVLENPAKSP